MSARSLNKPLRVLRSSIVYDYSLELKVMLIVCIEKGGKYVG